MLVNEAVLNQQSDICFGSPCITNISTDGTIAAIQEPAPVGLLVLGLALTRRRWMHWRSRFGGPRTQVVLLAALILPLGHTRSHRFEWCFGTLGSPAN